MRSADHFGHQHFGVSMKDLDREAWVTPVHQNVDGISEPCHITSERIQGKGRRQGMMYRGPT